VHLAENRTTGNLRVSLVDDTVLLDSQEPEFCHYSSQFRGHMIASLRVVYGGVGAVIPGNEWQCFFILMEYF
jgi:hypothetical protein